MSQADKLSLKKRHRPAELINERKHRLGGTYHLQPAKRLGRDRDLLPASRPRPASSHGAACAPCALSDRVRRSRMTPRP